jgi:hypothetical protein
MKNILKTLGEYIAVVFTIVVVIPIVEVIKLQLRLKKIILKAIKK